MMIICRRTVAVARRLCNGGPSTSLQVPEKISRFASEPCLNQNPNNRSIYATEKGEIVAIPAEELIPAEWKFCPTPPLSASEEALASPKIHFIVIGGKPEHRVSEDGPPAVYVNSVCERVAFNRPRPWEGLFSCSLDVFSDILFAWSENVLLEHHYSPPVMNIKTVWLDTIAQPTVVPSGLSQSVCLSKPSGSMLSLISQQKAIPLLEQLFWGDQGGFNNSVRQRFISEGALNDFTFATLPRRFNFASPRRKHRSGSVARSSLRFRSPSPLALEYRSRDHVGPLSPPSVSLTDYRSLHTSYRNQSLPPYIRQLDREAKERDARKRLNSDSEEETIRRLVRVDDQSSYHPIESNQPLFPSHRESVSVPSSNTHSLYSVSPSITIDDLDEHSLAEARIVEEEVPFIDSIDCDTPLDMSTEVNGYKKNGNYSIQGSVNSGSHTSRSEGTASHRSYSTANTPQNTPRIDIRRPRAQSPMLEMFKRRISLSAEDPHYKCVDPQLQRLTTFELLQRRRHSYIPGQSDDEKNGARRRSLSPMTAQNGPTLNTNITNMSLQGSGDIFRGSSIFGNLRDTFRKQSFTPVRRMNSSRDRSREKRLMKPPAILVYTGGHSELYHRIRESLSSILLTDLYTVFHISPEAIRAQPWVESSSVCLLLADTTGLDDMAWAKLHTYFNHSGKIIFVCQNKLLSSLTNTESSKKQAHLLKMAFGDRSAVLGKDFEHFLKKSLKTLHKHNEIHETFHSKDLVGGCQYSVVLSKKQDSPMLLYMENSAHQASAIFSDATSEQLIAPGSKVVRDALSRVGISVLPEPVAIPSLTRGYFIAKTDDIIENMVSMRYGEEVGFSPRIFMRKSDRVKEDPLPTPNDDLLPVEVKKSGEPLPGFNAPLYFDRLKTGSIGRALLHIPVATTTMDVIRSITDALPGYEGIVVVAKQQIHARGRGGNEFVAPVGAAMFSFNCFLSRNCSLAQNPSFVQHIMAVAVAEAVHKLSGVENFPFRIKWPNDFYYNRSHKIGGLLASAKSRDDGMEIILGVGLNVANSKPTVCLNDVLPDGAEKEFTCEEVIAESLNKFEEYLVMYEMKGQDAFLKHYYEYWLHSREEVTLEKENEKVVIRGLDKWGYLQVRSKKTPSKIFSVSDDGNTFDMMKGLIRMKLT